MQRFVTPHIAIFAVDFGVRITRTACDHPQTQRSKPAQMNATEGVAAYFAIRRNSRAGGDFPLPIKTIFIKMPAYKEYEDEKDNHDNHCGGLFVRMQ